MVDDVAAGQPLVTRPAAEQTRGADDTAFFGHPRGLAYVLAAEACWAFAFFGVVTILTLYMTQRLFTPGHVEHVWGFAAYSAAMQGLFGQMTPLALASQTFGLITGLAYATPILGGFVADRWLGTRRAVTLGLALVFVAHALLVFEATFLVAAALLVLGCGLVRSNLAAQIGRLYALDDPRRTRAFGLLLIALNCGAFVTPLVVGTLGEKIGWAQGLAAAAASMALGLVVYVLGGKHLPPDAVRAAAPRPASTRSAGAAPARAGDARIIAGLLLILVIEMLNVATYNQAFNIFPVWATAHVDRDLFGFVLPVTWFSTLDGILSIIAIALAVRFWAWQSARGREPRDTTRIAIGCFLTFSAFAVLALGSGLAGAGKTSLVVPIVFFLLADAAIPWGDTVILSLISRTAPAHLTTTMLGAYYLAISAGNFVVGALGRLYDGLPAPLFWGVHALIIGTAGVGLLLAGGGLSRLTSRSEAGAPADQPASAQ